MRGMNNDSDVVRPVRIPAELNARIRAWAESQSPSVTISAAIRHLLERAMADLERKRLTGKVAT